jgi:hypothetical protein
MVEFAYIKIFYYFQPAFKKYSTHYCEPENSGKNEYEN